MDNSAVSVCQHISGTTCPIFTKLLCTLPMSVAQSSSGSVVISLCLNEWMNECFICQHICNTLKTVKSRTVSTGWKGSKSTYNCPVPVARSSSGGVAICYVIPALWMTSCLYIMARNRQRSSDSVGSGLSLWHVLTRGQHRSGIWYLRLPCLGIGWYLLYWWNCLLFTNQL